MVLEGVEDLEIDVLLLILALMFVVELLLVTEDAETDALEDADATEPETEEAADEIESAELGRLDGFDTLEAAATDVEEVDALLFLEALAVLVVELELELLDFCLDLVEFELLLLLLLDSEVPSFDFFFPRRRRLSMKAN
jgi:hypothetical protein